MSQAHFKVEGQLDGAGGKKEGRLTIDRAAKVISVRPLRGQREYTMRLDDVADMICRQVIYAEHYDRKKSR